MDLDLFGAFQGEEISTVADASVVAAPLKKKRCDDENATTKAKRSKIDNKSQDNDDDLTFITTSMTSTSEAGATLTKFSAVPVDYSPGTSINSAHVFVTFLDQSSNNEPAKIYPFKLDPFQQEAVNYIERNESVLVAAHTSAGKTAVAEYAIAKSLKNKQRVIYTSPIKALSNQKFRDIQEEFGDVGLMTGDITINPNATCLIMTTEILRNMLYRGSEVMREVAWVIYDEVHYMRDKERGVVWEESIILLPHKVRFVFLSATIPNAKEFVGWVAKTHHQPCHVVYTDYRPVPLQHFVFPAGAEGLYLVVDEKGKFREDNFQRAMSCLHSPATELEDKKQKKKSKGSGSGLELFQIVRLIMEKELDPCIIFSFSKRDCETYALKMSRLDFNNDDEKSLVEQVFQNALESLSEDDKQLPQIATILPLLKKGVGIHHGGLLPVLKEIIEILFQEGLIKCLFATETFSIGINMPAKTVVFTQTRKYDGQDFRWITSGEYIQMSGRAGRRGKDDRGIVIQMLDEKMEPDVAKGMIYGDPDPLFSSYHVGYNMVLNMLRVEDADPENILRMSFHQYQQEQNAPEMERQADEIQRAAAAITLVNEAQIAEIFTWTKQLERTQVEMLRFIRKPQYILPFLHPGRLVRIRHIGGIDYGWGVLVNNRKSLDTDIDTLMGFEKVDKSEHILDILLEVVADEDSGVLRAVRTTDNASMIRFQVVSVTLETVTDVSAVRLSLPKDLKTQVNRNTVLKTLKEVQRRFQDKGGVQLLDPVTDMGIAEDAFREMAKRAEEIRNRIAQSGLAENVELAAEMEAYNTKMKLLDEARKYRQLSKESQTLALKDELKRMKRVLRRLGYTSPEGVLQTKGRFACELNTADELVLTDMVFEGLFNELSVEQSVALLSSFVHQEKIKEGIGKVRQDLQGPFRQLQAIARNVAKVMIDARMTIDEEEYVNTFNPDFMEVAYAWCSGAKFADICKLTDIFEGSIIRVIRRLEELLRQIASAALAIGNTELKDKFENGANKIRRGVVFAASLYL